jgi:Chaperone for flagella basal body P-ring formation
MDRVCLWGLIFISVCSLGVEAQQSRVIDDAALHTRWILMPDPEHPAGLGHWIRIEALPPEVRAKVTAQNRPAVLIHTGDVVTVVHQSETMKLQLEAKALENAAEGGRLHVRLKTGAVVEVIAVAAGRVDFAPHFERHEP